MRLKLSDLAPDGVRIVVNWEAFVVGASILVPAINTAQALVQVRTICDVPKYVVEHQVRIEGGRYGIRIWRVV
jgi:hypothetical protein